MTQHDKAKRWQISIRGMMATITAFCIALGLLLWARQNNHLGIAMLAVLTLCELIGGVIGWLNTGTSGGFWSGVCVAGCVTTLTLINLFPGTALR